MKSEQALESTVKLLYKPHQISKFTCFSSRFAVVFAQFTEVMWSVENEDVIRATPTGAAPTASEWSRM